MKTSLSKDQRGLGHVVLIALVVLVIAAVGFAGYRVSTKNKKDSDAATTAAKADKSAVAACNAAFHDKDLCKFTGNYALDKLSYKMEYNGTNPDGAKSSMTYLSDGKGNSSSTLTGSDGIVETVAIGKVNYWKDSTDGKWFKFAPDDTSAPKATNPTSDIKVDTVTDSAAKSTLSYKKLGKEKCGNLTCFKYQMIDSTKPNAIYYMWFDDQDYRMQHYYSKDDSGTMDIVMTYQAVTITAPSPTKDFNMGADAAALQQAAAAAEASSADQ